MSAKTDDLEAVRLLADTLQPFTGEDRERIIRWAREKLGMTTTVAPTSASRTAVPSAGVTGDVAAALGQTVVDVKRASRVKAILEHFATSTISPLVFGQPPGLADSLVGRRGTRRAKRGPAPSRQPCPRSHVRHLSS